MTIDPHVMNPAWIDPSLDSRAATFENPTGARGAGGTAHGGRKGAPNKELAPGETVVLADLEGPGVIRHLWLTIPPARPERMRAQVLEVRYDGRDEPSIAAPVLDLFGLPHGRPMPYSSALVAVQEGRGFNAYFPMPFRERCEIRYTNASDRPMTLYYQVDYTLQPSLPEELGYLHVSFRRQNPTVQKQDFVIAEGLRGPGRFLGCAVGVRVIDHANWYGEGEVKVYRDGDTVLPTICGTGLEDYVGSAWGMGEHHAPYGGVPLVRSEHGADAEGMGVQPDFVGFYRWHLPDPIMFERDLTVTIQQIGAMFFTAGQEAEHAAYQQTNPVAGEGWRTDGPPGLLAWGICERVDDYCATAYVYCREPQSVPPVDVAAATADIGRRPYEQTSRMEVVTDALAGAEEPGSA
ncbi:MAG TPA: glycoside hydrolase family 172 protein [Acidimicrobiales bacterium]|nr:glycoside hydrolase family 172 protein [Acidimicrobiales bacterium]